MLTRSKEESDHKCHNSWAHPSLYLTSIKIEFLLHSSTVTLWGTPSEPHAAHLCQLDKMNPFKANTGLTRASKVQQTFNIRQFPKTQECPAVQVQRIRLGDDPRLPNRHMKKVERWNYLGPAPPDILVSQ